MQGTRLITLHKPRRNTYSNEQNRAPCAEAQRSSPETKQYSSPSSSSKSLHNSQKNFDEDGYLSPLEIKAKIDTITRRNPEHSSYSEQLHRNSWKKSQVIYRYHDPNISSSTLQNVCQREKRVPSTSFASEFQKSLSIVDYIDDDVTDESSKQDDDPLDSVKYLFDDDDDDDDGDSDQNQEQGHFSRRIPRRTTNVSSISTDSGYSDIPVSTPKLVPIHLISCTLIPVNLSTHDSINTRCLTCTCRPSSSLSTTCLSNQSERKFSSPTSRSYLSRQTLTHSHQTENGMINQCTCHQKYHSTMTIHPPLLPPPPLPKRSIMKINDYKDEYYYRQQAFRENRRTSFKRLPTIPPDDFSAISRWYKPYLEREAVCEALQQADYGTFILRNSTTHADCYALSIKVPKFTHESNIVHYLIEKTITDQTPTYRIKGTIKQFPTLLSLITHHSVMPEILPITLNLNESFTI
ncbi:hypothetical protein I4U23_024583 [Adineta vaga]|nr:hypothetical protein I4U23_024583 [Adineta vaga]